MSVWNFEGLVYGDPTVCDRSVSLRLLVLARVHSEPVKCPQQSVTYDHQAGKVSVVEVGRVSCRLKPRLVNKKNKPGKNNVEVGVKL